MSRGRARLITQPSTIPHHSSNSILKTAVARRSDFLEEANAMAFSVNKFLAPGQRWPFAPCLADLLDWLLARRLANHWAKQENSPYCASGYCDLPCAMNAPLAVRIADIANRVLAEI